MSMPHVPDHPVSENHAELPGDAERKNWSIPVDHEFDRLLTPFGIATLQDRYLLEGETPQDRFASVARAGASGEDHARRLYGYFARHWFMPATPVLSNMGADRGLPISCFVNEASDDMNSIISNWSEDAHLGSKGGGIGSYWGNVRSVGESISRSGKTSGVVPFMVVLDALTRAVSQGSLRRASAAAYLPVWHPEIEEFIAIRTIQGGEPTRKALNLHHGVSISDEFMKAVDNDELWSLRSPKTGHVIKKVSARTLWTSILLTRVEQGEPYLLFEDTVNRLAPLAYRKTGERVKTSNLCTEITLMTGPDRYGINRTGVCCLGSMNLNHWDDFRDNQQFFDDVAEFQDNILQFFINTAPDDFRNATYSAMRERSVGIGVMGFHSALQQRGIIFGSPASRLFNIRVFDNFRKRLDRASERLADLRGPCPDNADVGVNKRFLHVSAIAPTATISIIAGGASPGIDPVTANVFLQKTLSGSFTVRNRTLERVLEKYGRNTPDTWTSITMARGSVAHLDFLTDKERAVFRTALEIDQSHVVSLAADRTEYVDQASSTNLFIRPDVNKTVLHRIHYDAWARGLKSLYYCRSISLQQADRVSDDITVYDVLDTDVRGEDFMNDGEVEASGTVMEFNTGESGLISNEEICESCQ